MATKSDEDLDAMTHQQLKVDVRNQMTKLNYEIDGSRVIDVVYQELDKVLKGFKV